MASGAVQFPFYCRSAKKNTASQTHRTHHTTTRGGL